MRDPAIVGNSDFDKNIWSTEELSSKFGVCGYFKVLRKGLQELPKLLWFRLNSPGGLFLSLAFPPTLQYQLLVRMPNKGKMNPPFLRSQ